MTDIKDLNELRAIIKLKEQLDGVKSFDSFGIMLVENELLTRIVKEYAEYNEDEDLLYEVNLMEATRSRVANIDNEEDYYKAILRYLQEDGYWYDSIYGTTSVIYTSLLLHTIHSIYLDKDAKQYGISKLLSPKVDFHFMEDDDYATKMLLGNNDFMENYSEHIPRED